MEPEPKKQDEEELNDEDLDGVAGGTGLIEQPTGLIEQPTVLPRTIVPKLPNTTPKLPSGSGS